jgi:hypothetical protein
MPISPEWLPETALLLAGVFAGAIGLHLLLTRRWSGGARATAISVACIVLALVLAGTHSSVRWSRMAKSRRGLPNPLAVVPAAPDSAGRDSTLSLSLGGVLLRVAPSDRYVFTVDGKQFLELDSPPSGLRVGCLVAVRDSTPTGIGRSGSPFRRARAQPIRLDAHTLRAQEEGKDVFRAHYAAPHRIEITGRFFVNQTAESSVVSCMNGIRWNGGGIARGATVDLTQRGRGRIDFERSGLIQVRP